MSLALCLRLRPSARVVLFRVPSQRRLPWLHPALPRSASFSPWSRLSRPSLDTAAEIAALEARANAHPDDLQNHLAFFKALIETRSKEGYDTLIDRWDHTAERVSPFSFPFSPSFSLQNPSSPLLRSDEAFELYLDALASSGREPFIQPAVRKRQSLLDVIPSSPSSLPSSDTTPPNIPNITDPSLPPPSQPPPPQSTSEKIAAQFLARRANPISLTTQDPSPPNPAIANLVAALSKGGGLSGNPIHVTLSERELPILCPHLCIHLPSQPKALSLSASFVSSSWPVSVASV